VYDFRKTAVPAITALCSAVSLQVLDLSNNNMNASAAQQLGNGLKALKEAGTLSTALCSIKLYNNPLTLGRQDKQGRKFVSSSDGYTGYSMHNSHWQRSIEGLRSLLEFIKGDAALELSDLDETAILRSLRDGQWVTGAESSAAAVGAPVISKR
jgi:hypothetical protein